jgi:glycosyltransferase involved in cell wall biosynthesis
MQPLVSVVISAYNSAPYLGTSIGSVLGQTWQNLECIVVDDGSTDSTKETVLRISDLRLHYHYKSNQGTVAAARNFGVSIANGQFIAFLDADDAWIPRKLEVQMKLFQIRPELGFVYCAYAITDFNLNPLTVVIPERRSDLFIGTILSERNGIAAGSTTVYRRSVFDRCVGFRTELSVSEDTEFASRAADIFQADGVDECLVLYRSHPSQGHKGLDAFEHDSYWILRDRFGDDTRSSYLLRRGLANVHTRLFYYKLYRGQLSALNHLFLALKCGPNRFFLLPLEAFRRKIQRRRVSAKFRSNWHGGMLA